MQKITAIILSFVLVFSITTTTFATEMPQNNSSLSVVDAGSRNPDEEQLLSGAEINIGEAPAHEIFISPNEEISSDEEKAPDEELSSDEGISPDKELSPGEETPPSVGTQPEEEATEEEATEEQTTEEQTTEEEPPIEQSICICTPALVDMDGIHTAPSCPFYLEVMPQIPVLFKTKSVNNFWSDEGNYNASWLGFTDYAATSEFTITDAADLAAFCIVLNENETNTFAGKTVTLANDIDLSGHLWDMTGGIQTGKGNLFAGTFDGNGHTISNMTIDYENSYVSFGGDMGCFGLFAELDGATISNLIISDSKLTIGYVAPSFPTGVGVLCGSIINSTVENVLVTNAVITQKENDQGFIGYYIGGIAGIEFCHYTRTTLTGPNNFINCSVDDLSITYSEKIDKHWMAFLCIGGMIGGVFPGSENLDPDYQSSISDCNINDVTIRRDIASDSLEVECYGGVVGISPFPMTINNTHVTNLYIDFGKPSGNADFDYLPTPFATAMIGGLIGYGEKNTDSFPDGKSSITNSSVTTSRIVADNLKGLLPVYVGGLVGFNNGVTTTGCYTQIDFTGVKNKEAVQYGNLFGLLETSAENDVTISNNIFNNYDYIATDAQIEEPSKGYLGEKLSTIALAADYSSPDKINLSQNWGILKNILTVGEKAHPLNYIQCSEQNSVMDFYKFWTVEKYSHAYLTQDTDTEQVTFQRDSLKDDTFSVDAKITSKDGNHTWDFTKDIIVLPNKDIPTYTVTYQPGDHGDFQPQEYSGLYAGEETPKFIGTPAGEEDWSFDGWKPEVAATVTANAVYTAQWKPVNVEPDPTGNLMITKTVTGNAGDKNCEFTFEVTFSDNKSYSYMGSKSGTLTSGDTVKLGHGENVTIQNIPIDVTYTVRELEADKDGYTTSAKDDTGTITVDGKTASFINHKTSSGSPDPGNPDPGNPDPTGHGDLTITKTVTGNAGDKKRDFTFEVIFSASGSYSYTGSKSGTITSGDTITLKHGQEVTVQNIPVGATYTVREVEADKDGYTTETKGGTGTITTDKKTASFTNHKTSDVDPDPTGDLTITKTVTGNAGDKKKEFTFKVTFDDGGTYSYTGSKSGTITSGDTVKLGHGQSITIEDIPVGVTYTVNEIEADKDGYTTLVKGGTGTITTGGKTAKFTNDKTTSVSPGKTGDLIIRKIVTGKSGNKNKEFTFIVTFDADGAYRYIGDKSGMITSGDTITLKNGQSITILDLPAGKTYRVTELEANQGGYETTVTGGKGKILADEAVTAEFVNHKTTGGKGSSDTGSPKTGDDFNLFLWISLLVLSGIGCIGTFIFKYRKTNQHKY